MNRESVSVLQVKIYCFHPNTEWFFLVMVLKSSQGSHKEHSQALNWAAFFSPNELWVVCKNGTPVKCVDGHIACKHRNITPYASNEDLLEFDCLLKHLVTIPSEQPVWNIKLRFTDAERLMISDWHVSVSFVRG